MLIKTVLLFLFAASAGNLFADTLTVRIENAEPGKGHVMIGVFNDERTFPDTYYRGQRTAVTDRAMTVTFTGLPAGQYAVSVYQDANDNERLDTNIFGIPKEKYGFSGNAGRPDYRRCLFNFDRDMTITITLK
jgi:uncharacterized protein (DUF2141 family)